MAAARLAAGLLLATAAAPPALASVAAAGARPDFHTALTAIRSDPRLAAADAHERLDAPALLGRNADRQETGGADANFTFYEQCPLGLFEPQFLPGFDCLVCLETGTCEEGACCSQFTTSTQTQLLICPPGSCCVRILAGDGDGALGVVEAASIPAGSACGNPVPDDTCTPCGIPIVDGEVQDCPGGILVPDQALPAPDDVGQCSGTDPDALATEEPAAAQDDLDDATALSSDDVDDDPVDDDLEDDPVTDEDSTPATGPADEDTDIDDEELEGLLEEIFACFPASATVELEGGAVVPIDSLAIGDSVKVGKDKYSDVFMFTHRLGSVDVEFVILRTESGATLAVTGGHYIYANGELVSAATVHVGDELVLGDGGVSDVTSVDLVTRSGLYNPQTVDGNIVVDGILASTYTTAVEPTLAHMALAPLRFLSKLGIGFAQLESGGGSLTGVVPKGLKRVE